MNYKLTVEEQLSSVENFEEIPSHLAKKTISISSPEHCLSYVIFLVFEWIK